MSHETWKPRGSEEKPYKARKISHEANTNIEYGEKTWTTAQTVRDLMQNHLDAETERYFKQIAGLLFGDDDLERYAKKAENKAIQEQTEEFLHAAHLFAKHIEDMTPSARWGSEKYLQELAHNLPVKEALKEGSEFSPYKFLEAALPIAEERPLVSYEVVDTKTKDAAWVACDTLANEALYQEKIKGAFRFQVQGMKIADHGAGFDSQLSALYISSKGGKRHLRGKFGEGAKMSELHLLRNGAAIKLRSSYVAKGSGAQKPANRTWQTRAGVKGGRLVTKGVEVEQDAPGETGSALQISLRDAKPSFRAEFLENSDPRTGGLGKNIAEFSPNAFVYPMPLTEKHLSGIDIDGEGTVQYVQGLRVELAAEAFGYSKPWYSYNFLDSGIIAGRDRNEIKSGIANRVEICWRHIDSPELLQQLVRTAVHDTARAKGGGSPELSALRDLFVKSASKKNKADATEVQNPQQVVDEELRSQLRLQEGVPTLLCKAADLDNFNLSKVMSYAREEGYVVVTTAADLGNSAIDAFSKRLPQGYKVVTTDILGRELERKDLEKKREVEPEVIEDVEQEGEREQAIRVAFQNAANSVNALVAAAGLPTKKFNLQFDFAERKSRRYREKQARLAEKERDIYRHQRYSQRYSNERSESRSSGIFEEELMRLSSFGGRSNRYIEASFTLRPPVKIGFGGGDTKFVYVNPDGIIDPVFGDARAVQRQIEVHLVSAFADAEVSENESLKKSQQVLDSLITKLIPEDSTLLSVVPENLEYEKDPNVMSRLLDVMLERAQVKNEEHKRNYDAYRKAIGAHLTVSEAQELLKELADAPAQHAKQALTSRVFLEEGNFHYYNRRRSEWVTDPIDGSTPVAEWSKCPVYRLSDGRYFVAAPMSDGAVVANGEGKKRQQSFSDGENILRIEQFSVGFEMYRDEDITLHPAGIVLRNIAGDGGGAQSIVDKVLREHTYYPKGVVERGGHVVEGMTRTAIPIEYGQDEWDNPTRVFQDIVQNHIDASEAGKLVHVTYEVEREGKREWVDGAAVLDSDAIVGLKMKDQGMGYFPNDIATLGASSKRSPLFAGKYGEGQKMVAAAALRSGLNVTYESTVLEGDTVRSWNARAVSDPRTVVLDGIEVEKKIVAFDVTNSEPKSELGSSTVLQLPAETTPQLAKQWAEWIAIVDPRQKDANGHGGLARYVRQLREPGSERIEKIGSISVLVDEPGAVYENGLRINPLAEKKRDLTFGYDVPEIVTTRERNSYNPERLKQYIKHVFVNLQDPMIIDQVLRQAATGSVTSSDVSLAGLFQGSRPDTGGLWTDRARQLWPRRLVYCQEKLNSDLQGSRRGYDEQQARGAEELAVAARRFKANLVHIDSSALLDVPERNYDQLARLLPTAEAAIKKLEVTVLPLEPKLKHALSTVVAEGTKIFATMFEQAKQELNPIQMQRYVIDPYSVDRFMRKVAQWDDASAIEKQQYGVVVAPMDSGYQGQASEEFGVVFNEGLFLQRNDRRTLAEVALHEMAHTLTGLGDYTERFVTLLYELAHHLANTKVEA